MTRKRSSSGIGRMSLGASAGTLGSRVLGFGRNLALAAALGTGLVADSYNIANQVPNQVFLLLGGGTISFVFIPQLMRHFRASTDRGDEYGSFLLLAGCSFGILVTVALIAFSPSVIRIMGGGSWDPSQFSLSLQLFMWCIPQIIFYTLFAVASQLMNARGRFSEAAWAPAVNSIIIIIACIPIVLAGTVQANNPKSVTAAQVMLLGGSALFGAALQTGVIVLLLHRAGFRLRYRFKIRGLGLRNTAAMGVLTFATTAIFQLAVIVTAALSTQAGSAAEALGSGGRGYTAFLYAQTVLLIMQGVASAGMANVLLMRLSSHYADGNRCEAAKELNEAILAIGALLIPVMGLLICLGPLGSELVFARGETSRGDAKFIGVVLAVLAAGLVPYALHDLLIRPFFAIHSATTPLRSAIIVGAVWIVGSFAASALLAPDHVLLGIAAAFSISYLVDLPLKLRSLKTRLDFDVSSVVRRGYVVAFGAASLATVVIGSAVFFAERSLPREFTAQLLLCLAGAMGFFAIYVPLTARSPASLVRLLRWLRR